MKKALLVLASIVFLAPSSAQGTITFFSLNQIFRPDGTGVGQGFLAGLFLASDLNAPIGVTDFVPDTGYLNAINVIVPGHPVGDSSAVYVVRVWESLKTYETSIVRGESHTFISGPLGGPNPPNPAIPPPDLDTAGTQGFNGIFVPEPSTYAMGAIGLLALAIMRRRSI